MKENFKSSALHLRKWHLCFFQWVWAENLAGLAFSLLSHQTSNLSTYPSGFRENSSQLYLSWTTNLCKKLSKAYIWLGHSSPWNSSFGFRDKVWFFFSFFSIEHRFTLGPCLFSNLLPPCLRYILISATTIFIFITKPATKYRVWLCAGYYTEHDIY